MVLDLTVIYFPRFLSDVCSNGPNYLQSVYQEHGPREDLSLPVPKHHESLRLCPLCLVDVGDFLGVKGCRLLREAIPI